MASEIVETEPPNESSSGAESWIRKRAGVCGGNACVRDTRTSVRGLVERRKRGLTDAEILERLPHLTPADLKAAWNYYDGHPEEIETAIRDNAVA
jgi:uncharacterized protein (DUF433 family)